ncbi:hypothetical protein ACHAWT_007559 [Skeletonema menzelii]
MLVPSLMAWTLFGSLQKIIQRPTATSIVCHRILESSTPLFASSAKRPSFGQLLSSDLEFLSRMNEPSCPCCSFVGKSLFLPWGTNDVGVELVKDAGGSLLATAEDVLSPSESWQAITSARADAAKQQQPIALVDTHGHPHLERSVEYAVKGKEEEAAPNNDPTNIVVSITCAVSPIDWDNALTYACRSRHILPALGVHPWYLGDILMKDIVESNEEEIAPDEPAKIEQYLNWEWLTDLELKLSQHPNLIVGEIGLCKMARFVREFPKSQGGKATALHLQKIVFKKQMELAARWRRPVTVHCVNAHGLFKEALEEILHEARESCSKEEILDGMRSLVTKAFPPAIAMHSFTGTAHHVQEILDFERRILYPDLAETGGKRQRGKKKRQNEETDIEGDTDILFYFGFSHSVNHIMCTSEKAKRKGIEAVQTIPSDRLLVESDVHATEDVILGTAGAAAYVAQARGESLQDVAETSTRNGLRFISSLSSRPVDT